MTLLSTTTKTRRLPLEALVATGHGASHRADRLDWLTTIDKKRWYVCPTVTPLYYAPIYRELDHAHQLRYNQLTAILFNELIAFFESEFASSVCAALAAATSNTADQPLVDCLRGFVAEEHQHIQWWRKLSELSEPDSYRESQTMIFHVPAIVRSGLRTLTRNPRWFPVVFWVMLALEERSLDISRRCLRMNPDDIEPHYLAIYRDHLKDETRHVHIDWHLIDRHYATCSMLLRKLNAWLFRTLISHFLLPPNRSAVRVVRRLAQEHAELVPSLPKIEKQLRALGSDPSYQEMMYSRAATPVAFRLFDRFPEMHSMQRVLSTYSVQKTSEMP